MLKQQQMKGVLEAALAALDPATGIDTGRAREVLSDALVKLDPHEPVFELRAQDRLAYPLVKAWTYLAEEVGSPQPKVDGADTIANEMLAWQQSHRDRVKWPD